MIQKLGAVLLISILLILPLPGAPSEAQDAPGARVVVVDDFSGRTNEIVRLYLENEGLTEQVAGYVFTEEEPSFANYLFLLQGAGYLEVVLELMDGSLLSLWDEAGDVDTFLELLAEQDKQCSVIEPAGVRALEAGVRALEAGDAGLPHGDIVVAAMEELANAGLSNAPVDIMPVDVPGLDTDEISVAVDQAIADAFDEGFGSVVVNMSWVVLPCAELPLYYAYYSFAGQEPFPMSIRQIFGFAQGIEIDSRFLAGVRDMVAGGESIVLVGAAGNEGDGISYFPASLPEVISVSASASEDMADFMSLLVGGSKAAYSNEGEVMLPGTIEVSSGTDTFLFEGTSFATPRLSYLIAYQLARSGTSLCSNTGPLALAYSLDENGMDYTLPDVISNSICIDLLDNLP